jgi:ligand-binding SRPBCC domain-containing protein
MMAATTAPETWVADRFSDGINDGVFFVVILITTPVQMLFWSALFPSAKLQEHI